MRWDEIIAVWMACMAFLLAACGAEQGRPDQAAKGPSGPIPLRSAEERAFDEKLAAIHAEWMGTAWTFSGTSQIPRQGSIACGYFVTTTLEKAGMVLERVRLAQAASEAMIVAITPASSIKRYSNASLEDFLDGVRRQGEGYYIVGLDYHTGFLKVEQDGKVTFVHSGPGRGVVMEEPQIASELADSQYRVTGKIAAPTTFQQAATGG